MNNKGEVQDQTKLCLRVSGLYIVRKQDPNNIRQCLSLNQEDISDFSGFSYADWKSQRLFKYKNELQKGGFNPKDYDIVSVINLDQTQGQVHKLLIDIHCESNRDQSSVALGLVNEEVKETRVTRAATEFVQNYQRDNSYIKFHSSHGKIHSTMRDTAFNQQQFLAKDETAPLETKVSPVRKSSKKQVNSSKKKDKASPSQRNETPTRVSKAKMSQDSKVLGNQAQARVTVRQVGRETLYQEQCIDEDDVEQQQTKQSGKKRETKMEQKQTQRPNLVKFQEPLDKIENCHRMKTDDEIIKDVCKKKHKKSDLESVIQDLKALTTFDMYVDNNTSSIRCNQCSNGQFKISIKYEGKNMKLVPDRINHNHNK